MARADPNTVAYRTTMDHLNYFMVERRLPTNMRHTLRDFFTDARMVNQVASDGTLLSQMSPLLRGSVAIAASKRWLDQVRCAPRCFLRPCRRWPLPLPAWFAQEPHAQCGCKIQA